MEPIEGPGREPREGIAEEDGRIGPLEVEMPPDLLEEHRLSSRTDREMHVPAGGEEHLKEPHRIGGTGGTGDRQDERQMGGGVHVTRPSGRGTLSAPQRGWRS